MSREHVGGHHVQGNFRVLQSGELEMLGDQPPQTIVGKEVRTPPEETQESEDRAGGEHVAPRQRPPDVGQRVDAHTVGSRCDPPAVQRAHRGADDQIRRDAGLGQTAQHPDLDRTQTGAAGEDEGGGHGSPPI